MLSANIGQFSVTSTARSTKVWLPSTKVKGGVAQFLTVRPHKLCLTKFGTSLDKIWAFRKIAWFRPVWRHVDQCGGALDRWAEVGMQFKRLRSGSTAGGAAKPLRGDSGACVRDRCLSEGLREPPLGPWPRRLISWCNASWGGSCGVGATVAPTLRRFLPVTLHTNPISRGHCSSGYEVDRIAVCALRDALSLPLQPHVGQRGSRVLSTQQSAGLDNLSRLFKP